MIELSAEQAQELDKGKPVPAMLGGCEVVLLHGKVYRAILAIRDLEKAVIAAGHTRGPAAWPEPLEDPELGNWPRDGQDLVILRADRFDEISECAEDALLQEAWLDASHKAALEWMKENPY